jgi:hypothetical protein
MQGYRKVSVGPLLPVHYIGQMEDSMQGYIKGT